jgi:RNA polymerase sigma-70 factor (ECF subfamily)
VHAVTPRGSRGRSDAPAPRPGRRRARSAADRAGEVPDAELCRALVSGDAHAADAVFDRVEDAVDSVLVRLLGPADPDRDDLMQQAIERVIGTIVSKRFSQACSLRSWATVITQHLVVDTIRARARERKLFDRTLKQNPPDAVNESAETPERAAENRRRIERLFAALARVNRRRAEAVVMHDILGHDLAEMARIVGVSVAAAQSRLVRGRREVLAWIREAEAKDV